MENGKICDCCGQVIQYPPPESIQQAVELAIRKMLDRPTAKLNDKQQSLADRITEEVESYLSKKLNA